MTVAVITELEPVECYRCSMVFALSVEFVRRRRRDHKSFYCPQGHGQAWSQKSDIEKERERRKQAERDTVEAYEQRRVALLQRETARRSAAAIKGHRTKILRRLAAGVCPIERCTEEFAAVGAHVLAEHPDIVEKYELLDGEIAIPAERGA